MLDYQVQLIFVYSDVGERIFNYTIHEGSIVIDNGNGVTSTLSIQSRSNSKINASSYTTSGSFEDRTDQWGTDFSSLNNDATALKDWFVTNGWWPGSAILADGRVTILDDQYQALDNSEALILATEWKQFRNPDFNYIKEKLAA